MIIKKYLSVIIKLCYFICFLLSAINKEVGFVFISSVIIFYIVNRFLIYNIYKEKILNKVVLTTLFCLVLLSSCILNMLSINLDFISYMACIFILIELIFDCKNRYELVYEPSRKNQIYFASILVGLCNSFSILYKSINIYLYIPFVVLVCLLSVFLLNPNNYIFTKDKFSKKKFILIMILLFIWIAPLMFYMEVGASFSTTRLDLIIYSLILIIYPSSQMNKYYKLHINKPIEKIN